MPLSVAENADQPSAIDLASEVAWTPPSWDEVVREHADRVYRLAYRLTGDIQKFPQASVFVEANVRHLFESTDAGVRDPNTGGTALFLTPGFRVGFNKHVSFTFAAPIPVVQELNGTQLKTLFKMNAALTLSF